MSNNPQNNTLWFAPPGIEQQKNIYFRAQSAFAVDTVPSQLTVQIAAESWYRLWCNGQEVASGPARGSKNVSYYDTLDLTPFLQVGENQLQVLAGTANIPTFKIAPLRPALWVELEGKELSWQVAVDTGFDRNSNTFNFHTGFCEWRDLRVQDFDWQTPEFFTLDKTLLPRDCALLKVSSHAPVEALFPISLQAGEHFIFDFNRAIVGGAQLEVTAQDGTQIETGYGEYLVDGRLPIHLPDEAHTYADRFITGQGVQIIGPTLQERGLRYLQVTASQPLVINAVRAIDRRHPLPPPAFHCEDESFNRLYNMAHHTVSSCSTDAITDCPWREQALWMNDMIVNVTFWLEAGGDPQLVARCLNLSLSQLNEDGLIYGVIPSGDREEIVFPATNAFLPLMLLELARFDEPLALSFLPRITAIMQSLEQFTDTDGLLVGPEKYWNFLDWSFEGLKSNFFGGRAAASINGFYLLALEAIVHLHGLAAQEGEGWQQKADRVGDSLRTRFWDEERSLYREFEDEEFVTELAQALACLSNRDREITATLSQKLAQDSDELFKPDLYMMHFVNRVLVENGHHDAVKARLLRYWGAILEANSPTIWEMNVHQHGSAAFGGAGSLCHAFACSPLWVLPRIGLKQ